MVQTVYSMTEDILERILHLYKNSRKAVVKFEALDSLSQIAEAAGHDQVLIEANGPITAVLRKYE